MKSRSSVIVVIMGVAGSGKTTVGTLLARAMHCRFLDGDSLHSAANVEKMSRGIPLTDDDRAPWLAAIHGRLHDVYQRRVSLVVACSALTRGSRAILAEGIPVRWVYLKGPASLIRSRLRRRTGHYMRAGMLASQLDALEEPSNAIVADISQPPGVIVRRVLEELRPARGADAPGDQTR